MTIKIPSKNIYSQNGQVLKKNIINALEIKEKRCQIVTDYHAIVNNSTHLIDDNNMSYLSDNAEDSQFPLISANLYYIGTQYAFLKCGSLKNIKITIPKLSFLKRVSYVYDGTNKEGYNNIGYTVNYEQTNYDVTADATLKIQTSDKSIRIQSINNITKTNEETSQDSGIISDDRVVEYKVEIPIETNDLSFTISTTCRVPNLSTIPTAKIIDNGAEYEVTLTVLTYKDQYSVRYIEIYNYTDWQNDQTLYVKMNGKGVEYKPKSVDITIYGDTINLDISEIIEKINENNNNKFSTEENELIQTTNIPTPKNAFQPIINNYQNGKETATLLCDISDYYDNENSELVISANGNDELARTFRIGDEVIPYTYTAMGTDVPMSTDKAGNPKVFSVVGTRIFYDGAVWQELTLLEK